MNSTLAYHSSKLNTQSSSQSRSSGPLSGGALDKFDIMEILLGVLITVGARADVPIGWQGSGVSTEFLSRSST